MRTESLLDNWAELGTKLRRFVGARIADPHAADDVTQDVLLKVLSYLDGLPSAERPRARGAWAFAVARNAVIDHHRSRAARARAGAGYADLDALDPAAVAGAGAGGSDDAERRRTLDELAPCLTRMVDRLPEPYRQAMRWADLEGLGQQELADRAGLSLSGAKTRVQRARRQLREMIEDCCRIERDVRGNVVDYHAARRTERHCGNGDRDSRAEAGEPPRRGA